MEETQAAAAEAPVVSNVVGLAMATIILGLGVMIWNQNTKLEETVKVLAAVTAKCSQK